MLSKTRLDQRRAKLLRARALVKEIERLSEELRLAIQKPRMVVAVGLRIGRPYRLRRQIAKRAHELAELTSGWW